MKKEKFNLERCDTHNILMGEYAGINLTTGSNNIFIGKNAGVGITDKDNQIRIGNFTDSEVKNGEYEDSLIFDNGRVVITKTVLEFLGFDTEKLLELNK